MPVSRGDVSNVAGLARLGLDPARIDAVVRELNGILEHMEVLGAAETGDGDERSGTREAGSVSRAEGDGSLPLRPDEGPQLPLARRREAFAPEMRDGFFLVPRLATHEGEGERSP